jgi:hypothetical protein
MGGVFRKKHKKYYHTGLFRNENNCFAAIVVFRLTLVVQGQPVRPAGEATPLRRFVVTLGEIHAHGMPANVVFPTRLGMSDRPWAP